MQLKTLLILSTILIGKAWYVEGSVTPAFFNAIIQPSDITTANPGYTISAPGRYLLANDIYYNPAANGYSAISITANNVVLDMNGFSICQTSGNTKTGLSGIKISGKSVNIRNGQVYGMDVTSVGGIYLPSVVSDLTLECISVNNCHSASGDTSAFSLAAGDSSHYSSTIKIVACSANNNTSSGGLVVGFSANYCLGVNFTDCWANNNSSSVAPASGYITYNTIGCNFKNCYAKNNHNTSGGNVYGFRIDGGSNSVYLTNCHALYQSTASSGYFATGFYCYGASACYFTHCSAIGQLCTSTFGIGMGYYITASSTGIHFDDCLALASTATVTASSPAYGFYIDEAGCITYFNACRASFNVGGTGSAGFLDNSGNSFYTGCLAIGNYDNFAHGYVNYNVTPSAGTFPAQYAYTGDYSALTAAGAPQETYYNTSIAVS